MSKSHVGLVAALLLVLLVVFSPSGCEPIDDAVETAQSAEELEVRKIIVCTEQRTAADGSTYDVYVDSCCENTGDRCQTPYGNTVADYLGYSAHSNGGCTGGGSGAHQCAMFVKQFYTSQLRHQWSRSWGSAAYGLDRVRQDPTSQEDRTFVYRHDGNVSEDWLFRDSPPRETDLLFHAGGAFGHVVVVREVRPESDGSLTLTVIEENYGSGDCRYRRQVKAYRQSDGFWRVDYLDNNSAWRYQGLVRHNLAGIFPDVGWHDDGVSQAFRDAYRRDRNGKELGWAFDNGGGPFVHEVDGLLIQDFRNSYPVTAYGLDGETALIYSYRLGAAYLVREGFWGVYKCLTSEADGMGGARVLGPPIDEEHPAVIDTSCNEVPVGTPGALAVQAVQHFEFGCLWYRGPEDGVVRVHLDRENVMLDVEALRSNCNMLVERNPPGTDCEDECSLGESSCADNRHVRVCGRVDADACYEWLTMDCAAGLNCSAGWCRTATDYCGDGQCDDAESPVSCPADCGVSVWCGNGLCELGETSVNCPNDCLTSSAGECVQSSRRCDGTENYAVCIYDYSTDVNGWMSWPCPSDTRCQNGECLRVDIGTDDVTENAAVDGGAATDESSADEMWPEVGVASIDCRLLADELRLTVRGPIAPGLVGRVSAAPIGLYLGCNSCGGWSVPYATTDSRPWLPWSGDAATYELSLPPYADGLNLAVVGTDMISWFCIGSCGDYWTVTGDCHLEGTLLRLGAAVSSSVDVDVKEAEPTECAGLPHDICCRQTALGLELTVSGSITDLLVGDLSAEPFGLFVGCNTVGGWSVPYETTDARPWLPWSGDATTYQMLLPSYADGLNLALVDELGDVAWFDLEDDWSPEFWTVSGDCRREGTLIVQR